MPQALWQSLFGLVLAADGLLNADRALSLDKVWPVRIQPS